MYTVWMFNYTTMCVCVSSTSLSDNYRTTYKYEWTKKKTLMKQYATYVDNCICMHVKKPKCDSVELGFVYSYTWKYSHRLIVIEWWSGDISWFKSKHNYKPEFEYFYDQCPHYISITPHHIFFYIYRIEILWINVIIYMFSSWVDERWQMYCIHLHVKHM